MSERQAFTTAEVATRLGINVDKVVAWIKSGELSALNVATKVGGRARYRIPLESLLVFQQRRAVVPQQPALRRKSRRRVGEVTQFF